MPPKKSVTAAPKKAASSSAHTSYQDMISDAIIALKERSGSSRQAIKKYVQANNKIGGVSDTAFNSHINRAIAQGVEKGHFEQPKGASGPVKLKKSDNKAKAVPAKKETKKAATATTTTTTTTTTKKAASKEKIAAPKKEKAAPKKAAAPKKEKIAAKPATKKIATKANTGRGRKAAAPTSAPAVEEKPVTVLGKTKSGRVTKTKAPVAAKPAAKAKKAAAGKKATPRKKIEA